jgi:predicted Ser/Thr protein kinase
MNNICTLCNQTYPLGTPHVCPDLQKDYLNCMDITEEGKHLFNQYISNKNRTLADILRISVEAIDKLVNECPNLDAFDQDFMKQFFKTRKEVKIEQIQGEIDVESKNLKRRLQNLEEVIANHDVHLKRIRMETSKSLGSTTVAEFAVTDVRPNMKMVEFDSFGFTAPKIPDLSEFCSHPPDRDDPEIDYQSYLCNQFTAYNFGIPSLDFKDTHTKRYLEGRKPDLSFIVKGKDLTVFSVVVVGEVKTRKTQSVIMSDSSLGEIVTFIHRVIKFGVNRTTCFGFITDAENIYFIKTIYNQSLAQKYSYEVTPMYPIIGVGGNYLFTLLSQLPELLGWCGQFVVNARTYDVEKKLGEGLTSTVWESEGCAIKQYRADFKDIKLDEIRFLKLMTEIENVPHLVEIGDDFIIMEPVGKKIEILCKYHIRSLLKTLEAVHALGIVHRDVRLTNIVELNGAVLLLDWGYATNANMSAPYRGSIHYASNDILASNDFPNIVAIPQHDLYMLVRVVYVYITHFDISQFAKDDRVGLANHWNTALTGLWSPFDNFCDKLDYASLSSLLCDLFGS